MSSTLVHERKFFGGTRDAMPPPARLTSVQLRELSAQWRMRAGHDEDVQKAHRVADVLDWLASQREPVAVRSSWFDRARLGFFAWMRA